MTHSPCCVGRRGCAGRRGCFGRHGRGARGLGLAGALLAAGSLLAPAVAETPGGEPPVLVPDTRPLAGAKADVAALLLGGRDSGALPAAVTARVAEAPGDDGTWPVDLTVDLDGAHFLGGSGDGEEAGEPVAPARPVVLEIYAYAMTSSGELIGRLGRRGRLERAGLAADPIPVVRLEGRLGLPPGSYHLRVLVRETPAQRLVLRVLPLAVPAAAGQELVRSAPAAVGAEQRQALELAAEHRSARRVVAVAEAYRRVLERLASRGIGAAATELGELERQVLGSGGDPDQARGWLAAAQERVIGELAERDPGCLVPLLVLHLETHERYLRDGVSDPYLLGGVRERIVTLARGHAREGGGDGAAALAASALAELGVLLDGAGLAQGGRRMLTEALELDPADTAARLYLAYWHERRGRYEEAVELLQELVELAPGSEEGRVRLALSLRRLGRDAEAEELLRAVIRDGREPWLLTLAYEEQARLLLGRGQCEEAVRVLEAGVARLPDRQRLHVQLAYALERAGLRQRSREVIAALPPDPGRPSPRYLYSEPPLSAAERSRSALLRQANARLPSLARALAEAAEPGR